MKIFKLLPTTAPSISRSKAAYHRKGTGYCWGLGRLFGIVVLGLIFQSGAVCAAEQAVVIAAPTQDISGDGLQTVVFAGGCFWGVQGVFQHVKGVTGAVSGYSGGAANQATYGVVSNGRSGHAEAVQVQFDPQQVSYGRLLQIFFSVVHNPTQLNRQGPDFGTQYRSAIFTTSEAQSTLAKSYIQQLDASGVFGAPIVTKVSPLQAFYPAEAYHQDYLKNNPLQSYIVINDVPKVHNLEQLFASDYRSTPVLVGSHVFTRKVM